MLLCAEYVIPITSAPIKDGAVLVEDGMITAVGTQASMRARYPEEPRKNLGAAALLPGFISTHIRLEDYVMRGFITDVPYTMWLSAMRVFGANVDEDMRRYSALAGCMEALKRGITCVADTSDSYAPAEAIAQSALRGIVFREVEATYKSEVDDAMFAARRDMENWAGLVDLNKVTIGIGPASMYKCHPEIFKQVSALARKENMPVSIHMAGSREVADFVKYGSSPFKAHGSDHPTGTAVPSWLPTGVSCVQFAKNWDAFEAPNVIARHCVQVDDEDIRILKDYDVAISICPRFNAQLGMGVSPLSEFRNLGMRCAFGNDSPAATDSIDLFEEMRLGMFMERSIGQGEFVRCSEILRMVTIDAARVLGKSHLIGSLEAGKRADMIAVDITNSHRVSAVDPEVYVVNNCGGPDILMTMIDGEILYEDKKWHVNFDTSDVVEHMAQARKDLRI